VFEQQGSSAEFDQEMYCRRANTRVASLVAGSDFEGMRCNFDLCPSPCWPFVDLRTCTAMRIAWANRQLHAQGVKFYMISQCEHGSLQPELYRSGSVALALCVEAGCDALIPSRDHYVGCNRGAVGVYGRSCMTLRHIYPGRVAAGHKCLRSVQALK